MSIDASGTVAGAITFAKWRGRNYVRRHAVPSNPRTQAQVTARSIIKFLGAQWDAINAEFKATWADAAESKKISPFNQYIAVNARNWRDQLSPSSSSPAAREATPGVVGVLTASVQGRLLEIEVPFVTDDGDWGLALVRSGETGVTGVPANVIQILEAAESPVIFADGPLAPGEYFYNAFLFTIDGVPSAIGTETSETVT
jgi:hypothetical protein